MSLFLKPQLKFYPQNSERKPRKTKHMFWSLFIPRGHSARESASGRVTSFILRAYTGSGVSHSQHRKKLGEVLEKNEGKWTGRVERVEGYKN